MQKLPLLIGFLMIGSCYAFEIINMEQYIKEAKTELTEESLKLQKKLDARLPVTSLATVGKVDRRTVSGIDFSNPIFIIGADSQSQRWLKDHAKALEAEQAIGFIANIQDSQQLQALQALTKAPLLPANIDDLMVLFQESHYPLAFHKGELWQ